MLAKEAPTTPAVSLAAAYSLLGLAFAAYLLATLSSFPLFPFRLADADWSSAWLLTTVADYYTSTFCLCGVIVATEGLQSGALWSLACCLLGSPFCCAWTVRQLWRRGSLRVQTSGLFSPYAHY